MTTRSRAHALRACFVAAGLAGLAAAAQAALPLQPGLWEETTTFKTDDARMNAAMANMQARLAAMPPEQRQRAEQMLGAQSFGKDGMVHTLRVCMTKEQIARDFVPDGTQGNCTHQRTSQSGNVSNFTFTCTGKHPASGQGVFTLTDSKTFSIASDATIAAQPSPQGGTVPSSHVHSDIHAHFVASDCGSVRPDTGSDE